MNIEYKKNNNKCPYCNDNNYIVYGSHKENEKDFDSKLTEFINNHAWVMPVWFILSIILIGIIEGL